MADERADRLYKRKRLRNPANPDGNYVDIPVVYKATFKTMAEQAQERIWYIKNGADGDRSVRVQIVRNPNAESMSIAAERIERIQTKTTQEQAQEHNWYIANTEPPPRTADSDDPSHERKHIVRYIGNSSDSWVDIELIDTLKVKVAAEQYQDYLVDLNWPDPAQQDAVDDADDPFQPITKAVCDPSLELIDGPETLGDVTIDPPYRLDPFQNIVNIHWPNPTATHRQIFIFRRHCAPGDPGCSCTQSNNSALAGEGNGDWFPMSDAEWIVHEQAGETKPSGDIGSPGSSLIKMQGIAFRTKLSDLIAACASLSKQAGQSPGPSDSPPGSIFPDGTDWNPWAAWGLVSIQPLVRCSDTFPAFDVVQPSSANAPAPIYNGFVGGYEEDDTTA